MTSADLLFNAERHEYSVPDGRIVPGVTSILKQTGVSVDFEALPNRDAIERRRAIGTAFHADSHALCDGDLDWSTVHPDVLPFSNIPAFLPPFLLSPGRAMTLAA